MMRGVGTSVRLTPDRPEARGQGGASFVLGDAERVGISQVQGWERLRPSARVPAGARAKFTGARACAGPAETHPRGGPAGAPGVCLCRRRLQGVYWGQGLLTGTRPPKLALKRGKWPRIPLLGSPFKATGTLSQGTALEGMLGVEEWRRPLMVPPHTSLLFSPPSPLPPMPHCPGQLTDAFTGPQSYSQITRNEESEIHTLHTGTQHPHYSNHRRNADQHMHIHSTYNSTAPGRTHHPSDGTAWENTATHSRAWHIAQLSAAHHTDAWMGTHQLSPRT